MYTCQTCSKEYTSQKRYLSHMERCEEQDSNRSRASLSGRSRSMTAFSDIEDDIRSRSLSRSRSFSGTGVSLKDTVDRLMKDRARYKAEIKKYKTDIRSRVSEHQDELERNQEYFQEQIFTLTEERDELSEQVNIAREEIFTEKERLRSEFGKKISTEKKRLETRFGGKNASSTSRLQTTVEKLQERLNAQMAEKEHLRDEHETHQNLLMEQNHNNMEQLNDELRKTKHLVDREREEIRKTTHLFQTEKDTALSVLRREKDQEIQNVIVDKDTIISSLEFTVKHNQKEKELLDNDCKREIADLTTQHILSLQERNRVIDRLKDTHARAIDACKLKYEGIKTHLTENATKDLLSSRLQHDKIVSTLNAKHADIVRNIRTETMRQIQELGNEVGIYKQKMVDMERDNKLFMEKTTKETNETLSAANRKQVIDKDNMKREMDSEHKEQVRDRDDTIMELERLNHALGAQVGHYRSAMDNMKNDTTRLKQQFVSTLNKQKIDDDNAINERETRFNNVQDDIKNIQKHTTIQLQDAEQRLKIMSQDKESLALRLKTTEEALNNLQRKTETIELRRSSIADNYEKRIDRLKADFTTKMTEISSSDDTKYQMELDDLRKKLKIATDLSDQIKRESMAELNNQRHELLSHGEKGIDSLSSEVDKLRTENRALLATLEKDRKSLLFQLNDVTIKQRNEKIEMTKQLEDSKRDLQRAESITLSNRKQFTNQLNAMTKLSVPEKAEMDKMKEDIITKNTQIENCKKICSELNTKLSNLHGKFLNSEKTISQERESLNKEKEAFALQSATPVKDVTSEAKLRKMRDDCIESLRRNKIEITELKQGNIKLKRNIAILEEQLISKNKEIENVLGSNKDLKASYVENLNAQKIVMGKVASEKQVIINKNDIRISELEALLSDTVRKLTK
jgi:hypothetical protein